MSVFANLIGISNANNKIIRLTEKQMFENDYERLKNKFNFGNINPSKNINSFPLRLISPNYQEISSIENSSKKERNHYINSHKISSNYTTNENKDIPKKINALEKIQNYIKLNNVSTNNHRRTESRNTINSKNLYNQESLKSKSKEKTISNYNNIHQQYKCNNPKSASSNKKISYLKKVINTTDTKNQKITKTHASTDFKFSDKSIEITSSNNNSLISHSLINNVNKQIPLKSSEENQLKMEKYNSNFNFINFLISNENNLNTQSNTYSNKTIYTKQEQILKKNENIKNLSKNNSVGMIDHTRVNSNIVTYNNFYKINNLNSGNKNRLNQNVKSSLKNMNSISYKNSYKNDNKSSYNQNNKSSTAAKSVSSSTNYSRIGTPSNFVKVNDENKNILTKLKKSEKTPIKIQNQKKLSEISLCKNTYTRLENHYTNKINNNLEKDLNEDSPLDFLDENNNVNSNFDKNNRNIIKDNNKQIQNFSTAKSKENRISKNTLSYKTNQIADQTERKTERIINEFNINDDEENDIAFANALEDLSQSNESSINELIQPLNKKIKTSSSHNIPSEEDVERKEVIYNDKIQINSNIYQKSRENMNVDGFVEESEKNPENSKDKNDGEEEINNYDSFENYAMHQINTRNLFINNPVYDLSSRLINDEKSNQHQMVRHFEELKFIENIKKDKKNNYLSIRKLWLLNDDCICNILSFSFPYFQEMIKSNIFIAKKLYLSLCNKFSHVIFSFREKFSQYLELEEFLFRPGIVKKHRARKPNNVIDLVLKSRIKSSLFNHTFEISFSFKLFNNPEEYINIWKFDLKNKNDISLWFASEAEEYKNNIVRHCYFHPIISFYLDDVVRMRINIFSKMGMIDPNSIKFNEISVYKSPPHDFTEYEKSIIKNNKKFEKMRICELENMVHLWKNEKSLSNKANIDEFKKYFSVLFKIYDISYDFAKFYIFKVKMEAKYPGTKIKYFIFNSFFINFFSNLILFLLGLIRKNKFTNFELEIKPWKDSLINETQCLGLLNINQILPKVEIRVGTYVLFYFTDLYI